MRLSTGIPSAAAEACGFQHALSTSTKVDAHSACCTHFAKTVAEKSQVATTMRAIIESR
jgi:hypothetical protein